MENDELQGSTMVENSKCRR